MDRKGLFLILLFSTSAILSASPTTFTNDYNGPARTISTDLQIGTQIGSLQPVYCPGDTIHVPINIQPKWWPDSTYSAHFGSTIDPSQASACLRTDSTFTSHQSINWLSSTQYGSFVNDPSHPDLIYEDPGEWNIHVSGLPSSNQYSEASQYANPNGGDFNGGPFQAQAGMFCKGSVYLLTNGNPNTVAADYAGQDSLTYDVTAAAGMSLQARFNLNGCAASGRSVLFNLGNGCDATPQVWIYQNPGFTSQALSSTITPNVKPVYSCGSLTTSGGGGTLSGTQGQPVPFTFTITNGDSATSLSVTSISATLNGQAITINNLNPSVPIAIPAGGHVVVSGNVIPTQSGNSQPLAISISATTADCRNTGCQASVSYTLNINPGGGGLKTITCTPDKTTYNSPDTGKITVACSGGSAPACPGLQWAGPSWLSWTDPNPSPGQNSPFDNHFSIASSVPPGSVTITATCTNPALCANSPACQVSINVGPGGTLPDYTISSISVPFPYINEHFTSQVDTKNIGAATSTASTTRVKFPNNPDIDQPIAGLGAGADSTDPAAFTCPATSGNYNEGADADALNQITESNENNNHLDQNVFCSPIPNGCTLAFAAQPPQPYGPNDHVGVTATCTFNGQSATCPKFSWTETAAGDMNPAQTDRALNPSSTLELNGATPGPYSVKASSIDSAVPSLSCQNTFTVGTGGGGVGPYKIMSCGVNPQQPYHRGDSGVASVVCQDANGNAFCPDMGWSVTPNPNYIDNLQPTTTQLPSPVTNGFTIDQTAQPGTQTINVNCATGECVNGFTTCPIQINIVQGSGGGGTPDYTAIVTPHQLVYDMGTTAVIDIKTWNIGNGPALPTSHTTVSDSSGCVSGSFSVLPSGGGLSNGRSQTDQYTCTCVREGLHVITAEADADRAFAENYANNIGTNIFYCCPPGGCFQMACFDYF